MFLSIVQAVTEVLNKSHFSLRMGNYPIPVAEHSGQYVLYTLGRIPIGHRLYLLLKRLATWLGGGISSNGAQVCSRRSLKMNWSFSPRSSLWVMPKVEWWSHFSPRDSNLWKVSLMMISWNCNITLMNEMSNMAAHWKTHLSSFIYVSNWKL